jgi:hypothetical protein
MKISSKDIPTDTCPNAPAGKHCPHSYEGAWMGVGLPPFICCHCGVDVRKIGHGPYLK